MQTGEVLDSIGGLAAQLKTYAAKLPAIVHLTTVPTGVKPSGRRWSGEPLRRPAVGAGRMEGRKDGRTESWKDGRMEGWKDGRTEGRKHAKCEVIVKRGRGREQDRQ